MKLLFCWMAMGFASAAFAQKGLDEMIAAEKSFAAYAVAAGTREAFLEYADTASVMFRNAEPVNGYNLWRDRTPSPGILNWRPSHAEISASGDFGWTCGPWTFQPKTITDSVVATGYFFTIWQKKGSAWKFILDVGTDTGPIRKDTAVKELTTEKGRGSLNTMLEAEDAFIKFYITDTLRPYQLFGSNEALLVTEGQDLRDNFLGYWPSTTHRPGRKTFTVQGSGISPAGDLGYVYGTVTSAGKKETYLRIWRHELTGWKIAVQMLRL